MENEMEMWKGKYKALEQDTQAYIDKTLEDVEMQFRERIEQEKADHSAKIITEKNKFERENHELLLVNKQLTQEMNEYKIRLDNSVKETNAKINEIQRAYEQESKGYLVTFLDCIIF